MPRGSLAAGRDGAAAERSLTKIRCLRQVLCNSSLGRQHEIPSRPKSPRFASTTEGQQTVMSDSYESMPSRDEQTEFLENLTGKPLPTRLAGYLKLSGPGWLQSAITLGGGSLASSLYLGVLAGFSLLWLQPLAMMLGIIMLSAIGYVTLVSQERPFQAINVHVNPVLGWGWALAVAAANIVWCLPQYSLANGVLEQNLLPQVFGADGAILQWSQQFAAAGSSPLSVWFASNASKLFVVIALFAITATINWTYDRGGRGLWLYETTLKLMVAIIVLSFIGVVVQLGFAEESLDWSAIAQGVIPDFRRFYQPANSFGPMLDAIGPMGDAAREYWTARIVTQQRDVMIAAAATAVGINMTFLFPYSLLRKRWTAAYRGLAIFDLSTGMFIPYVLATGCVVIASGSQFHTKIDEGFEFNSQQAIVVPDKFANEFDGLLDARNASGLEGRPSLAEQKLAAALVKRDSMDLSKALAPLTGKVIADIIFGLGVLAMTLSTISILMLISGFVFCEMLAAPHGKLTHRIGGAIAGVIGATGPFVWGEASAYLAVPTSVVGFILLPFAYITFFLLMNQRSLLGDTRPQGLRRVCWNVLMGVAASIATIGSLYMIWDKTAYVGVAAVALFIALAFMVQINRYNSARYGQQDS